MADSLVSKSTSFENFLKQKRKTTHRLLLSVLPVTVKCSRPTVNRIPLTAQRLPPRAERPVRRGRLSRGRCPSFRPLSHFTVPSRHLSLFPFSPQPGRDLPKSEPVLDPQWDTPGSRYVRSRDGWPVFARFPAVHLQVDRRLTL